MPGSGQPAAADGVRSRARSGSSPRASRSRRTTTPGQKNYYPMMQVTAKDAAGATCSASTRHRAAACPTRWTAAPATRRARAPPPCRRRVGERRRSAARLPAQHPAPARRRQLGDPDVPGRARRRKATSHAGSTRRRSARAAAKPILCAHCHPSEALPGSGFSGDPPLTRPMHDAARERRRSAPTGCTLDCRQRTGRRATAAIRDPRRGACAASWATRWRPTARWPSSARTATGACPPSARPPGRAGSTSRPASSCHTGTATSNSGQIRFTSVFDASGQPRVAADQTFATSHRHAGRRPVALPLLRRATAACSARPATARRTPSIPSSHENDNVQSVALQGHVGHDRRVRDVPRARCRDDHTAGRTGCTRSARAWVSDHTDAAEGTAAQCQAVPRHRLSRHRAVAVVRAPARCRPSSGPRRCSAARRSAATCATTGRRRESAHAEPAAGGVQPSPSSTAAGVPVTITLAGDATRTATRSRSASCRSRRTAPSACRAATATYFPFAGFVGHRHVHVRRVGRVDRLEPGVRVDWPWSTRRPAR